MACVWMSLFDSNYFPRKRFHRGDIIPQSQFDKLAQDLIQIINPLNAFDELRDLKRVINNLQALVVGKPSSTRVPMNVGLDTVATTSGARKITQPTISTPSTKRVVKNFFSGSGSSK
uniref:Uncharacterized protein n=1 Tax=Cacopsylla melanoneura TaxID=428564 RepID=A0A8D8LWJ8_9HEMI